MVIGYSRAIYLEIVRRADVATFITCHLNAFEYFGGVRKRCLYDNAKVVVLGRDANGDPEWNRRMLDFSLRLGFRLQLCKPYRAPDQGQGGERYQIREGQLLARGSLLGRTGPEPPGDRLVRRDRQRQRPRHHRQGAGQAARLGAVQAAGLARPSDPGSLPTA